MVDAKFEDGAEAPLALRAETAEDLPVIAALAQDAVMTAGDMGWEQKPRRVVFLINRFRWEDKSAAEADRRPYERVRSLLVVSDVTGVASTGFDRADRDLVLSILDLAWRPGEDGTGHVVVTLAGDGEISIAVECLSVDLRDVSRPYLAVSGAAPGHAE